MKSLPLLSDMVIWLAKLRRTLILVVLVACTLSLQDSLRAQVQFFTTPPDIDSFPVVKSTISVAFNGKPASFDKSNFSVQEDGQAITNFQLIDCDESETASIALLVDVSESMMFTLWKGSDEFYNSFNSFTDQLFAPTEFALIPFNDTVSRIIPASYRSQDFFKAEDPNDLAEFIDSIGGLQFSGNTDVDFAIWRAAEHLKKGIHSRKAIVLMTDDGIYDYPGLVELLRKEQISLFVLELDADTIKGNIVTADETGGKFFSPKDSTEVGPMMEEIAKAILAKKCTMRYVSSHPCPWWSEKTLWIGLNYQSEKLSQTHYFDLGPNNHDSVAPVITEVQINESARLVRAEESFPCERGIKTFVDSALVNFAKLSRIRSLPQFGYDSLVVNDLSQPASGFYIATDSNGNTRRIRIAYLPAPDTLSPVWSVPFKRGVEQYQLTASEFRKGDRGLMSIMLDVSSTNAKLDSVIYASHRMAQAYVSRIDPTRSATACIIAVDSVGNDSSSCINFELSSNDQNSPVISQRNAGSPLVAMVGDVTELRVGDRGIRAISVTPITNVVESAVSYSSVFEAVVTSTISDSLYPAQAMVTAIDSAGNSSQFNLTYTPQPDVLSPETMVAIPDISIRTLTITEIRAWDRGLKRVDVVQSSNITATQLTFDRRSSDWKFVSVDPYVAATARIDAIDSAGNSTILDLVIPAQTRPIDLPLGYADPLDFGTVVAPALAQRWVELSNPDDDVVSITSVSWSGDDSVFSLVGVPSMSINSAETKNIAFNFKPRLLGDWQATCTLETDQGKRYPIRMKGSSTGLLKVIPSHENIASSGEAGELTVNIEGTPEVINLDTLQFLLELDGDVADLGAPVNTCDNSAWLCNYSLDWKKIAPGTWSVGFMRKSKLLSLDLVRSPTLKIPIRTFLSTKLHTDVKVVSAIASRAVVSAETGGITVVEACGDSAIMAAIADVPTLRIERAIATPEGLLQLDLDLVSDAPVKIGLYDVNGSQRVQSSFALRAGSNQIVIPVKELSSGSYWIVVTAETGTQSRAVTIVR